MFRLRTLVLSALSVAGFSVASAPAGCWVPTTCQTPCRPIIAYAPAPCRVAPVVIAPTCTTYYRGAVHCGPRVVHHRHCR